MNCKKRTNAALATSDAKYRCLFSSARDPIFLLDQESGAILDVNEAASKVYGYSRNELLTLKEIDISAEPDKSKHSLLTVPAHIPISYHKRKDGRIIPVEIAASLVDNDGHNTILASIRDITQRITMEQQLDRERELSNTYLDLASIMFMVLGRTGMVVSINKEGCDILGYDEKDVVGKYWFDNFLTSDSAQELKQVFLEALSDEANYEKFYENSIVTASGEERIISWHNTVLRDEEGKITGVLSAGSDITETTKAKDALLENERRLLAAQSMAQVGNWELSLDSKMIWASREAFNIYGIEYGNEFVPLNTVMDCVLSKYRNTLNTALSGLISRSKEYDLQFKIRAVQTGEIKHVRSIAHRVVDEAGRTIKVFGTIQDITEQKKLEEKLQFMSYHDELTGLYNRRFFDQELVRLDTVKNLPISLIMCDVNGLKLINDSFGHATGDELLKKTASVLKQGCRTGDVVARVGGDEFVIILPKTDTEQTDSIANHIKELAVKEKIVNIELSISYGYDTKRTDEESILEILANAENYMYRHKLYERTRMRSKAMDIVMRTLFEKSARESQHSERVSDLCEKIAIALNFKMDEVKRMKVAGLVHDIGKIGIDEQILNKDGKLSDDERHEMEKHSEIGWRILSSTRELSDLAPYVLDQHEQWDGLGYPNGKKNEEIPIEARIISVADTYDALTNEYSYQVRSSKEKALAEIAKCSGAQFDPEVVEALLNRVVLED